MPKPDDFVATFSAVLDFVAANRTFPQKDYGEGMSPTAIIEDMRRSYCDPQRPVTPGQADVLRLFLHRAPLLSDVVAPICFREANLSTDATYDPLTLHGLSDVCHLIHNGLLDDWWIALYEKDGVRRIVNEYVDDCAQGGEKAWPAEGFPYLDRDLAWMASANRTVLSMKRFLALFADDIAEVPAGVPAPDDLMELWTARPYDDFCTAPGLRA